jgi:hypothetical protein
MNPLTVWCVVSSQGNPKAHTARDSRKESISFYAKETEYLWAELKKLGYTCKKFTLTEVK